jgi:hypothetical protein
MGPFDRLARSAANGAVSAIWENTGGIVETVLKSLFDHPAYPIIASGQLRLIEAGVAPREAWDLSSRCFAEFLSSEGIEFGDARYDWSPNTGREIVEEIEINHWESVS